MNASHTIVDNDRIPLCFMTKPELILTLNNSLFMAKHESEKDSPDFIFVNDLLREAHSASQELANLQIGIVQPKRGE